ncbi:MAG: hypothetical protein ACE5I3_15945, partial [Phycisphaerae bacterium]
MTGKSAENLVSAADGYTWYASCQFARAFGRGKAARKRRLRWIARLVNEQKDFVDGRWRIRGDAVLPSGETVVELLQSRFPNNVPEEVTRGTEKHRQHHRALLELLQRDRQFRSAHPNLAPSSDSYFKEFARAHGAWAGERGLS